MSTSMHANAHRELKAKRYRLHLKQTNAHLNFNMSTDYDNYMEKDGISADMQTAVHKTKASLSRPYQSS